MKKGIRWRIILLLATTAIAVYYLLPTISRISSLPPLLPAFLPRAERLNLGLDLRGGMHLVLEVQTEKAVENTMERLTAELRRAAEKEQIPVGEIQREGQDRIRVRLAGADAQEKFSKVLSDSSTLRLKREEVRPDEILLKLDEREANRIQEMAVRQSLETIRNRVDQFGVTEPYIAPEGERRIVIQLPGIKEPERAINLVGKTAQLEFRLLDDQANLEEALKGNVPEGDEILYQHVKGEERTIIRRVPYVVQKKALLTGDLITSARAAISPDTGEFEVNLELDREGARIFGEVTAQHVGKHLAIVLDGVVQSAPRINEPIPGGRARITGRFTEQEATDLAIVLRAGALPAPAKIIQNLTVGPSLGQDSIRNGIRASILGGILVILIMVVYYKASGLIADGALLLNLIMMVGALAILRATLTLPGIAGIALTIGMAVDSNVLIFERIREELRLGKTVRSGIDAGYQRAWVTIVDSHVTTLITALALFLFGTGPIRGFAVTLSIGVILNLYTATVGTKVVFNWLTSRWQLKQLSI
ncbi:MAG: protein translocase subunit SecD [candidate division NC10 bacterium]|nr:protein translocase subunit SecD [candidate division NC10 bacterium]